MKDNVSPAEHVNWILSLEEKYPVEAWTIEDVKVWPLIRINLNFLSFQSKQPASAPSSETPTITIRKISIVQQAIALLRFRFSSLPRMTTITSGFSAHRVNWKNTFFNRYFDPVLDDLENRKTGSGLIVEYELASAGENYYKPDRVLKFYEFRPLLQRLALYKARLTKRNYQLERFDEFLEDLSRNGVDIRGYQMETLRKTICVLLGLKWFWKTLFRKTGAKVAVGLCYYSEPLYAMNLAAWEQNVTSVDLQHGGLGKLHLSYAQFRKLPSNGIFELLPKYFWCWDDSSASYISEWVDRLHARHLVIQKGHPWLQYVGNLSWPELDRFDKIVLLTLQPVENALDSLLIDTMKATSKQFKWFVRLHPRQLAERDKIKGMFAQQGLIPEVEIDLACDLPIPAIFSKAALHITRYSGSASEAALMGVPNVLIDKMAAEMYPDLIDRGQAVLYVGSDPIDFRNIIENLVQRSKSGRRMVNHNWDFLIDLR